MFLKFSSMLLSVTLLFICISTVFTLVDIEQLSKERQISSEVCIARGYCKAENAAEELRTRLGLSIEDADEVVSYTHNSTRIGWHSCSCSPACVLTNNCCPDADKSEYIPDSVLDMRHKLECSRFDVSLVPVVTSCPDDTETSAVPEKLRTLCVNGSGDGEILAKFTSKKSLVTYANLYCAMCHDETTPDILPWSVKVDCQPQYTVDNSSVTNKTLLEATNNPSLQCEENRGGAPPPELADILETSYGALLTRSQHVSEYCEKFNQIIDSCPPDASVFDAAACSSDLTSYVVQNQTTKIFKNSACARCNSAQEADLMCQDCGIGSTCWNGIGPDGNNFGASFAILIQPYPQSQSDGESPCKTIESAGAEISCSGGISRVPRCSIGEYLSTNTLTCVPICPQGLIYAQGLCRVPRVMKMSYCDQKLSYEDYVNAAHDNQIISSEYSHNGFMMELNNGSLLCHSCTRAVQTEYTEGITVNSNGSVVIDSTTVDRSMVSYSENVTFLCIPASEHIYVVPNKDSTTAQVIMEVQGMLTLILCIVSIICIILFFVAFSMVKRMRNIPGCTIAGNMLMFMLAYITFAAKDLVAKEGYIPHDVACEVMAVLINYFFLSGFIFMIIYAVLIIRSLEFVDLDARYTSMYVLQAWLAGILTPFIIIIPAVLMDKFAEESLYSPGYGHDHCFMKNREGNLVFFVGPIGLCLIISMVIYGVVVHRLRQIAAATSRVRQSHKEKVFLCFKLLVVLGFNWIFAILAAAVDRQQYPTASAVLSSIFVILCCLHGFFGFIVFVASGSNLKMIKDKIYYSKIPDSSSSGGRATRTLSGPGKSSSTAASEMSTMLRNNGSQKDPTKIYPPKYSPSLSEKFRQDEKSRTDSNPHLQNYKALNNPGGDSTILSPTEDQKGVVNDGLKISNDSPVSTRSACSQRKCDFF